MGQFAEEIVHVKDYYFRNMLMCPLPWEMVGDALKQKYIEIWNWMKKPTAERLEIFGLKMFDEESNNNEVVEEDFDAVPASAKICQAVSTILVYI